MSLQNADDDNDDADDNDEMTEIDDDMAVPEFPVLSEDEVREITWGVYQVAQAKNYCNTHMDEDGNYEVIVNLNNGN